MTTFSDQFQGTPTASLNALHGRTVTYNPLGDTSAGVSKTGRWTPDEVSDEYYGDGQQEVSSGILRFSPADVTDPDTRDTFTIDGEIWALQRVLRRTPVLELQLTRPIVRDMAAGDSHAIQR